MRENLWNWQEDNFVYKEVETDKHFLTKAVYEVPYENEGVIYFVNGDVPNANGVAFIMLASDKVLADDGIYTISFDIVDVPNGLVLSYMADDYFGVSNRNQHITDKYEACYRFTRGNPVGIRFAVSGLPAKTKETENVIFHIAIKNIKMERIVGKEDPHATPYSEYTGVTNVWWNGVGPIPNPEPDPNPDPEPEPEPEPEPDPEPDPTPDNGEIPKELKHIVEELNDMQWSPLAYMHVKDNNFFYCVDPAGVTEGEEEMYAKTQDEETVTLATFTIKQERYGKLPDLKSVDTTNIPLAFFNRYRADSYYILLQARIPMRGSSKDPIFLKSHELIASFFPLMLEHDPITITRQDYDYAFNPINGSDVEVKLLTRAPQAWISILTYFEKRGGALSLRIIPVRSNKEIERYDNSWWVYRRASRYVLDGGYEFKIDPYLCTGGGNGATVEDAELLEKLEDERGKSGDDGSVAYKKLLDKLWSHPVQTLTLRGSDTAFLKSKTYTRDVMEPMHIMAIIDESLRTLHIPYLETRCNNGVIEDKDLQAVFELGGMEDTFTLYDLLSATLETLGRSVVIDGDKVRLVPRQFKFTVQHPLDPIWIDSLYQPITKKVHTTQLEVRPPLSSFGWSFAFNSNESSFSYAPLTMRNERYMGSEVAVQRRVAKRGSDTYDKIVEKQKEDRNYASYNKVPHMRLLRNKQLPPRLDRYLLGNALEGVESSSMYGLGHTYVIDGEAAFQLSGDSPSKDKEKLTDNSKRVLFINTRHLKPRTSYQTEMRYELSFDCELVPIEELVSPAYLGGSIITKLQDTYSAVMRTLLLEFELEFLVNGRETCYGTVQLGKDAKAGATVRCIISQSEIVDQVSIELRGIRKVQSRDEEIRKLCDIRLKELDTSGFGRSFGDSRIDEYIAGLYKSKYLMPNERIQIELLQAMLYECFTLFVKLKGVTLKASTPNRSRGMQFFNPAGVSRWDRNYFGRPYLEGGDKEGTAEPRGSDYGGAWLSKNDNGDTEEAQLLAMPITEALMPTQNLYGISLDEIKDNIESKYALLGGAVFAQTVTLIGTNGLPHAYYYSNYEKRFNFSSDGRQCILRFLSQCEYSLQLDITHGVVLTPMYILEQAKNGVLYPKALAPLDWRSPTDEYTYVDSGAYDILKNTGYYPALSNGKYKDMVEDTVKDYFRLNRLVPTNTGIDGRRVGRSTTGRRR
ncbi:hypothetical protein [Porphyromonas somerae]|uniref:hypothetical protein n=1 Tax=Porphyromonas somerae TaxID=322095 RepID=UPI001FCB2078|nr:hypothetical protein [Porphyromonas somerae]BDE81767.1 hypothetical protein CE91St14_07950 [Porphyromonas somerae]